MRLLGQITGSVSHGQLTIGASATELSPTLNSPLARGVYLKADSGNSGTIYVGSSSSVTSTTGFPILATDTHPTFWPADDFQNVYVIGSGANQKLYWYGA